MPKFVSGYFTSTPGALALIHGENKSITEYLDRHLSGDWGDMGIDDKAMNDSAVKNDDDRIFSAYNLPSGAKIWIITEADRSVTTILLPDEY